MITTKNLGIYLSSEHFFKNRFSVGPFLSFQEIKNTTFNFYRLGGHLNLYLIKGKTISIYLGGSAGGAALSVGSSLEKARLLETFSKYMSVSGKNNPRQANLVRIQYNKDLAKAESYNEYIFSESFLAYVGLRFVFNSKIKGTMVFGNEDFLRLGINYSL